MLQWHICIFAIIKQDFTCEDISAISKKTIVFYINLFFGTNVFQDNFTHQAMLLQLSSWSNKLTLGHAFKLKLFSQNTLFKLPSICYYYRRTCEWTLVYELKWKYQSKPHNISSMRSYTTSYADIGDWKKKKTSSKLNFYTP